MQRFQLDGYPVVVCRSDGPNRIEVLHEMPGSFAVTVKRRFQKVTKVDGWGFKTNRVSRWRWSVSYHNGGAIHIRYIHAFHDFDDRSSAVEVGLSIAVQWIFADDRREYWRGYLIQDGGVERADLVLTQGDQLGREIVGESGWD